MTSTQSLRSTSAAALASLSQEEMDQLFQMMSKEDRETLSASYQALQNLDATNHIDTLFPDTGPLRRELYKKHLQFFTAGVDERERAFIAANRIGKSYSAGGYEVALHLMGDYPDWWPGRRFTTPGQWWAAGDTGETVREIIQPFLIGDISAPGTGLIRGDRIQKITNRRGSPEAAEKVFVEHSSGGTSTLLFKSYEQGRKAFQGKKLQGIWLDEEPPMPIYTECLLRLTATTPDGQDWGSLLATFTPLLGISDVVLRYLGENFGGSVETQAEFMARQAREGTATTDAVPKDPTRDLVGHKPRVLTDGDPLR